MPLLIYRHQTRSVSWSVKFAEEDPLPCAEGESSVFNGDCLTGADECHLDVAVAVAFHVPVTGMRRHKLFQVVENIGHDIGIMAFVDSDRSSGVG